MSHWSGPISRVSFPVAHISTLAMQASTRFLIMLSMACAMPMAITRAALRANNPDALRATSTVGIATSDIIWAKDTADLQSPVEPRAGGDVDEPSAIPSGLIELSGQQLSQLGIQYDSTTISYIEEGIRFVVSTYGISLTGSNGRTDARTPRHVTLYVEGKHIASWKRSNPDDDVDRLVGIMVRLQNPAAVHPNKHAIAVIWCIPPADMELPDGETMTKTKPGTDGSGASPSGDPAVVRTALRPNPVAGSTASLTIDVDRPCAASIKLYDMLGNLAATIAEQVRLEAGTQDITLMNLHEQPQGMYLVVIDIPETRERHARRLLIER